MFERLHPSGRKVKSAEERASAGSTRCFPLPSYVEHAVLQSRASGRLMRTIEPLSAYVITGRGQCYGVTQPDPPHYLGETILVPMKIAGIECFKSRDGDKPGHPIGLLVRVIDPEPIKIEPPKLIAEGS